MRVLSPLALGVTLAATVATASAQTVISREVTEELVETIVTQDSRGTVVTRRVLPAPAAVPVQPWQAPVTYNPAPVYPPVVAYDPPPVYPPQAVYDPAPIYPPRVAYDPAPVYPPRVAYDPVPVYPPRVAYDPAPVYPPRVAYDPVPIYPPRVAYDPAPVYPPAVTYNPPVYAPPVQTVYAPEPVDVVTTRQYVRPTARTVTRQVVVRPNAPIVARTDPRPARRVQRAVVLSPVEQRVVYRTIVQQQVLPAAPVVRDPYWSAPIVARTDLAPAPTVYPVGGVMPAAVPLYGVPETVAVRVPSVRAYSYAYIGGRIYLVDPVTSVIVADVTQY